MATGGLKLLFDEMYSHRHIEFLDTQSGLAEMVHMRDKEWSGLPDKKWVPMAVQEGFVIVTGDRNDKARGYTVADLKRMQANGRQALETAVAQVADTIRYLVSRYPQELADDLESEALVAACEAWRRFDPSKGASWPTFASKRIAGALQDYCRKHGREQPAESWEQIPEYEQDGAEPLTGQCQSNNPTVQRRIRLTVDTWAAVGFLANREGVDVSLVVQTAVDALLRYKERAYAEDR